GLGYDMFTDPARRVAIQGALQTGEQRATGRLVFGQAVGAERTYPGFLVFAPLADATVPQSSTEQPSDPIGVLFVGFRTAELFNRALGKVPLLPISIEIYDGAIDPDMLLFRSETRPADSFGEELITTREIKVAGRNWFLEFRPTSAFTAPTSMSTPILIGIG